MNENIDILLGSISRDANNLALNRHNISLQANYDCEREPFDVDTTPGSRLFFPSLRKPLSFEPSKMLTGLLAAREDERGLITASYPHFRDIQYFGNTIIARSDFRMSLRNAGLTTAVACEILDLPVSRLVEVPDLSKTGLTAFQVRHSEEWEIPDFALDTNLINRIISEATAYSHR